VADWIYVSSDKIHQLVFGLAPGAAFRHSNEFRTIFAADLVYYVLSGLMVIINPASGEVQRVKPGEAAFFRRDTWHHVVNYSADALRVLEFFAPPPSQGTSGAYARKQPLLTEARYGLDSALGRWPMAQAEIAADSSLHIVRENDLLWRIEGGKDGMLVGLLCSTEHLSVGRALLLPGQKCLPLAHGGDKSLYVLDGVLNVFCPDGGSGQQWFELHPRDGFYLPERTRHEFHNVTGQPVQFVFGVAPGYLP
jgi:mannose-6-phosphate isomerase-like protein (cupin superfamily)